MASSFLRPNFSPWPSNCYLLAKVCVGGARTLDNERYVNRVSQQHVGCADSHGTSELADRISKGNFPTLPDRCRIVDSRAGTPPGHHALDNVTIRWREFVKCEMLHFREHFRPRGPRRTLGSMGFQLSHALAQASHEDPLPRSLATTSYERPSASSVACCPATACHLSTMTSTYFGSISIP